MNAKDKVDLALRAALVARSVLQLMNASSKRLAGLIMTETVGLVLDLKEAVKKLPED